MAIGIRRLEDSLVSCLSLRLNSLPVRSKKTSFPGIKGPTLIVLFIWKEKGTIHEQIKKIVRS